MHTSPHPRTHRHPVLLGLMEALKIDLIIVPAAFVVATVFWIIGLGSQLPYSIIPEWAFALWAVVHGLSVSTIGFDFSLAPSLVTLGVWFLVAYGAKRLVEVFSDAEPGVAEDEESPWWKDIAISVATFLVAYAGPLLALALLLGEGTVTPFGFLRLLLLLASAAAAGYLWVRGIADIPRLQDLDIDSWEAGARLVKRLLWGSAIVAVIVIGTGLTLRWDDLADSMQAYSSPMAAGIGLLIIQILFAPGILFSGLSWIAGTGISIGGEGVSSVFHEVPGPVPQVPVLQLLTGDYPVWTAAAPVLLVLVGVLAVIIKRDHAQQVMSASWPGLAIAAIKLFVVLELLALFARGAMGPLGLSEFGPSPLFSAIVITAWMGLGLCIGLALTKLAQMQYPAKDFEVSEGEERFARDDES